MNFLEEATKSPVEWKIVFGLRNIDQKTYLIILETNLKETGHLGLVKDIPHLLLYGKAGTGKTTLGKLIAKQVPCDYVHQCK